MMNRHKSHSVEIPLTCMQKTAAAYHDSYYLLSQRRFDNDISQLRHEDNDTAIQRLVRCVFPRS